MNRLATEGVYEGGGWDLAEATWHFYDGNTSPTESPGSRGEGIIVRVVAGLVIAHLAPKDKAPSIHYRMEGACRSAHYLSPYPSRTAQAIASPRVLTPILSQILRK